MIAGGRCVVQQGDVSALVLPEECFDLATAFETIYFWPGLEKCFAQVAKVLKLGGLFLMPVFQRQSRIITIQSRG